MADPVMVWSWDDAPEEYRLRISRMFMAELQPTGEWIAMVFIPETALGKLLDEPEFLKPLWRAARCVSRARIDAGMLIAWL